MVSGSMIDMAKNSPSSVLRGADALARKSNSSESVNAAVVNLQMKPLPLVTLVVPGYNEAGVLERNLATIFEHLHSLRDRWRFEVLLINDGSGDDTGEIGERLMSAYPLLTVINHPSNFGLGQALKTAFAASSGDYVITLDLDLSYSVLTITDLLESIDGTGVKVVLASPYMKGGRTTNVPAMRLLLSRWANRMFAWLSGNCHTTFTCMVRAYDGPFIRALEPKAQGMGIMPEIVYKTMILGGRIAEVPAHLDWTGQLTDAPNRTSSMRLLSHIAVTAISGFVFRPFMLLLIPGIVALIGSLGLSLWLLLQSSSSELEIGSLTNTVTSHPVASIGACVSLLLGIQLIGLGAISLQGKKYYEETYFQLVKLRRQIDGRNRASADGSPK